MMCVGCGQGTAQLKVAKTVGHLREELWLCDDCARRLGIEKPKSAYSATEIFSGLFEGVDDRATAELTCPDCGWSAHDLRLHGRAGCERCYEVFVSLIREILTKASDTILHRGRYPRHLRQIKRILVDRALIKRRLHDALQGEDYEEAARLRDVLIHLDIDAGAGPGVD